MYIFAVTLSNRCDFAFLQRAVPNGRKRENCLKRKLQILTFVILQSKPES